MKLSSEDIFIRCVLIVCGVFFAIPTYILWKDVVVGHQWPDDFNGWLGLIMTPLFTVVSLLYAIFYRRAKKADDRLQEEMNENTRRGNSIILVGYFLMLILATIPFLESHIFKSEPWETWEFVALPLIVIVWVGGLIIALHNFITKKGWHRLDRLIYKDAFNDEEEK